MFGGFLIANLSNHQHLWILPKQVARSGREGQSAWFVYLGLHHSGKDLFNRIFDSDNMASAQTGEITETSVNGGRFAPACRARQEQQPAIAGRKPSNSSQALSG